jgi:hypothetical protein
MESVLWIGMAIAAGTVLVIAVIALTGLAVPYLVVRLKAEPPEDTQLGAKVAFQFFYSAGILVVVAGVTVLAVDWLTLYPYRYPRAPTNNPLGRATVESLVQVGFNVAQRTGVGLIFSGMLAVVVHQFSWHTLNPNNRLRIQRLFVGWRLAIHGVVMMLTLAAVIILLLQKDPFEEPVESPLRAATATFVVWGASWALHFERLLTLTKRRKREQEPGAAEAVPAPPRISPPDPNEPSASSVSLPVVIVSPSAAPVAPSDVSIAPSAAPVASSEAIEFHAVPAAPMTIHADMRATPALTLLDLEMPLQFPSDEAQAAAAATPRSDSPLPPPLPPPSEAEPPPEKPAEPAPEKPSDAGGAAQ